MMMILPVDSGGFRRQHHLGKVLKRQIKMLRDQLRGGAAISRLDGAYYFQVLLGQLLQPLCTPSKANAQWTYHSVMFAQYRCGFDILVCGDDEVMKFEVKIVDKSFICLSESTLMAAKRPTQFI